jgi:hypothetical protein
MQRQMRGMQQVQPGHLPPLHFFLQFFGLMAGLMIFVCIASLLTSLLCDFAMPAIALENAPVSLAWKRFGEVLKNDPPGAALYVVMKCLLWIACILASYIAIAIVLLPLAAVVILGGIVLHFALAHAGTIGTVIDFFAITFAILITIAYTIYAWILITGTVFIFLQAYAIYFLGGRYQPLGDVLEPPPEPAGA